MFKINEIFTSIQGEGANTGKPSLFIRVHGCDYNCSFCDSAEASSWESTNYETLDESQLIARIKAETERTNISNIVLTGGNPCLYDFSNIIKKLPFFSFEVETQGSRYANWLSLVDIVTISPKFYHKEYLKHLEKFVSQLLLTQNKVITEQSGETFKWLVDIQFKFVINCQDIENDFIHIENSLAVYDNCKDCFDMRKATLLKNIYLHFIDSGEDYNSKIYIEKFNKIFEYYVQYKSPVTCWNKYNVKMKLGVQLHKLLGAR